MFTIKPYFRSTGKGFKRPEQEKLRHRKQCTKKKTFSLSISFKTTNASQNKRLGNTQTFPSNMLINELELSYRWNSGWHGKKMVSYFVSKSTYSTTDSDSFSFHSTTDMFCRLESFVRGILQKPLCQFERNLDTTCWLIHVFCKKKKVF